MSSGVCVYGSTDEIVYQFSVCGLQYARIKPKPKTAEQSLCKRLLSKFVDTRSCQSLSLFSVAVADCAGGSEVKRADSRCFAVPIA